VDGVTFLEELLGEIGAVLARDAGDECGFDGKRSVEG
jgi:hypothetical protein